MENLKDIFNAIVIPGMLIAIVFFILIKIAITVRKRGGAFTHIVFGANQDLLTKNQRKAIKVIVNKNANKKETEQNSDEDY